MAVLNIKFAVEVNGEKKEIPSFDREYIHKNNPNNVTLIDYITNDGEDVLKVGNLYFYHFVTGYIKVGEESIVSEEGETIGVFKIGSNGIIYSKVTQFKDDEVQNSNFNLNNLEWTYHKTKFKYDEKKPGTTWSKLLKDDVWEEATAEEFANGGSISSGSEPEIVYVYIGTLAGYKIYKGVAS